MSKQTKTTQFSLCAGFLCRFLFVQCQYPLNQKFCIGPIFQFRIDFDLLSSFILEQTRAIQFPWCVRWSACLEFCASYVLWCGTPTEPRVNNTHVHIVIGALTRHSLWNIKRTTTRSRVEEGVKDIGIPYLRMAANPQKKSVTVEVIMTTAEVRVSDPRPPQNCWR